jgi:hypothetical protein
MKPKYAIGTWIRFYSQGKMVVDIVQYIDKSVSGTIEYLTIHNGHVTQDSIFEARNGDLI